MREKLESDRTCKINRMNDDDIAMLKIYQLRERERVVHFTNFRRSEAVASCVALPLSMPNLRGRIGEATNAPFLTGV